MGLVREWVSGFFFFLFGLVMGTNYPVPLSMEIPLHALVFFIASLIVMYQITRLPSKVSPQTAEGVVMALVFVWGFLATSLFASPGAVLDRADFLFVFGISALVVSIALFFIGSLEFLKNQQSVWLGGFVMMALVFVGSVLILLGNAFIWQIPGLTKAALYVAAVDFLASMLVVLVTRQTVEISEYWKDKPELNFGTLYHWYVFAQCSVWVTLLFRPDVVWKLFGQ